jgi:hypothetical protein
MLPKFHSNSASLLRHGSPRTAMKCALMIFALLASSLAFARGKRVTVTVVGSTVVSATSTSNVNCVGERCRGSRMSAPASGEIAIAAEIDGQHVILYCDHNPQQQCVGLRAGDYKGEVKDDHVWIKALPFDGKKSKRINYTIQ